MLEQRIVPANGAAWHRHANLDPSLRRKFFGPIRPMEQPGLVDSYSSHAVARLDRCHAVSPTRVVSSASASTARGTSGERCASTRVTATSM